MSAIALTPYLFFTGNCKEAMEYYHSVFGGELSVQMTGDVPGEPMPGMEGKVMHANLAGGAIHLMASDGTRTEPYGTGPISLTLSGSDEEALRTMFAKLSEGGTVTSELKKEYWGDVFGSLTDKYGIDWMVSITAAQA